MKKILILLFLVFSIMLSTNSFASSLKNPVYINPNGKVMTINTAKKEDIYIPSGTRLKGVLVNSFKCPIFGKNQCHVKIKLTGLGLMPNKYKLNLNRNCS
ncbi:MAG: hypothetical protein ACYCUT_05480, partial [bacterium]